MVKNLEYIAYQGESLTIEWFFSINRKSQALEYYQSLDVDKRIKCLKLLKRMGDVVEIKDKTKFISEGDKIYAFKPMPDRFLCFFYKNKKIIITNAFRKKQQKLPIKEKKRALRNREDYINRIEAKKYYE